MDKINGAGHVARRFVTEDAGLMRPPTEITAEWLNAVQDELVEVIEGAGLTLSGVDNTQLSRAIKTLFQKAGAISAAASGTVDAITANFVPAVTALTEHLLLIVRAAGANTSATPTFTPASATIPAKTIVKGHNQPLVAGDISGAGFRAELQYDLALDKWVLLNPATGVSGSQQKQIQSITATVAANALTLGLNPTSLDFRSSALTNGVSNTRAVPAPISLVVSSGSTLGTVSGQPARIALLAIDNAGTVELAVVNLAGGINLDETTLISTVAEGGAGGADSASAIYSASARANVPFRVVGFVDIAQAAAGTWATPPATIQGQGGQAMSAVQSIGYGQTWQNVTASRAFNSTYYNTSGKPIQVVVNAGLSGTSQSQNTLNVNGQAVSQMGHDTAGANLVVKSALSAIVPPGSTYSLTGSGSITSWFELK